MQSYRKKQRNGVLGLVLMGIMLMLSNAAPAGAVGTPPETGSGSGTGGFTTFVAEDPGVPPIPDILCLKVNTGAILELWNEGTYTATNLSHPNVKATYTGPTHATYRTSAAHYIGPEGTFHDAACLSPAFPGAPAGGIPGTLTVDHIPDPDNPSYLGGDVNCDATVPSSPSVPSGGYGRVSDAAAVVAHGATCIVTNTPPVPPRYTITASNLTLTFEGTQHPCLPPTGLPCEFVESPPNSTFMVGGEWQGTYTET